MAEVHRLQLPEYQVDQLPDFEEIGLKIDSFLNQKFLGQRVVMRGISASVHPISIEELMDRVIVLGHDRYDQNRVGEGYDRSPCDFFAAELTVEPERKIGKAYVRKLYEEPQRVGRQPQRLDMLLVYEPTKVECVPYQHASGSPKKDAFRFINPERKPDALKAVILIE